MYLLIRSVDFTKFCIYNNLDFCSIIHRSSIQYLHVTFSGAKLNIFWCSPPPRSYRHFPLSYKGFREPEIGVH